MAHIRLVSTDADNKPINLEDVKTVVTLLAEAFAAAEDVTALQGSSHSHTNKETLDDITEALTTELKGHYDSAYTHSTTTHAPAEAQANVIEEIDVNGEKQEPAEGKKVNITVPKTTSELENDSGFLTEEKINAKISAVYKPAGSVEFASLPSPLTAEYLGNVYNVIDQITTDENFVEEAGKTYPAGTNVVVVQVEEEYKFDVLSGLVDLTPYVKTETMTTELGKKQDKGNYAGSTTAGGSATSAAKLDTASAGSAVQPVYFAEGIPVAGKHKLEADVPSTAVFTDTKYTEATQDAAGLMSAEDKKKLDTSVIVGPYATAEEVTAAVNEILGVGAGA